MIREIKLGEEFFYLKNKKIVKSNFKETDRKIFVNSKKFIHNDVGFAYKNFFSLKSGWYWNGVLVE